MRLRDAASGVEVELLYGVFEDFDLITRAARITNGGAAAVSLCRAMSLCLDFSRADLDLITFDGGHAQERNLNRAPLRPGVQGVGSTRGMSSHQHNPFVILCERDAGEDHGLCYGAALLYSGDFLAEAERSQFDDTRLILGIHPRNFRWPLAPGESFSTPETALACSPDGLARLTHCLHRAVRERLVRDPYRGRRRPVLVNNWEATYFDFNEEKLAALAEVSAGLGAELFVMDDGWFGQRSDDMRGLGDWTVNREKLPSGLEGLVPRIQKLGMQFGIWVEPEMVSEDSQLYRQHPDWALAVPGRPPARGRSQLTLDFGRQEVREYLYRNAYEIDREDIVWEGGKFYPMFHVCTQRRTKARVFASERERAVVCRFGEWEANKSADVLLQYLLYRKAQYEAIQRELTQKPGEATRARLEELEFELDCVNAALEKKNA